MRRLFQFLLRNGFILPLIIVVVALVAALVYLAGTLGTLDSGTRLYNVPVTLTPYVYGTPIVPFAQIDPSVLTYLDNSQSAAGVNPLLSGVQPIGAYLPSSGSTQFELPQPTERPTLLPYPTSPPLLVTPLGTFVPTAATPGENFVATAIGSNCAPFGLPVDGILTQRFHAYHSGIDIGIPLGTPLVATQSGQVIFADWSDVGYGYLIIIQSGAFITYYAHQTSFNVHQGDFVIKGSIIGFSGSTGNSSGPHVHYETRIDDVPVDPLTFEARGYPTC
jgi:murein DD-endopeptidase MepM/ murein hydrolase activator NlpD